MPAPGEDPLQNADLFIGKRLRSWSYGLSEARQYRCIDPICFGEPTRSPGELSCLARVDHRYRQPLGGQSRHYRALEASGGLNDHQLGALLEEPRDQGLDPSVVVGDDEDVVFIVSLSFASPHADVQLILGDVHPRVDSSRRHGLQKSSLLLASSLARPATPAGPSSFTKGPRQLFGLCALIKRRARRPFDFFAVFLLVDQGRSRSVAPTRSILRPQIRYKAGAVQPICRGSLRH